MMFELSEKVIVHGRPATVKFVGEVHYAKGQWIGVELDAAEGKNNGTIKGVEYFSCKKNHGMMVRPYDVKKALSPDRTALDERKAGNECFRSKDWDGAIEHYSNSLMLATLVEEKIPALSNRAAVHLCEGSFKSALKDAEAVLLLDKSHVKATFRRAKALQELGKLEEALSGFKRLAELAPNDASAKRELKATRRLMKSRHEQMDCSAASGMPEMNDPAMQEMLVQELMKNGLSRSDAKRFLKEDMMKMMGKGGMGGMFDPSSNAPMLGMNTPPIPPAGQSGQNMAEMMLGMGQKEKPKKKLKLKKMMKPLHSAARNGDLEKVRDLLAKHSTETDKEAFVNELDGYTMSALTWACKANKEAVVDELLLAGAKVHPPGDDCAAPLGSACYAGHEKIVKKLLDAGADISVSDPIMGHTALHRAVDGGKVEIVSLLLDHARNSLGGVSTVIELTDNSGLTALAIACGKGDLTITKLLIDSYDASVKGAAVNNASPLGQAVKNGKLDVVEFLLSKESSSSPSQKFESKDKALQHTLVGPHEYFFALCSNKKNASQILQALRCDEDASKLPLAQRKSVGGITALHLAAKEGDTKATRLLLKEGASPDAALNENFPVAVHSKKKKNHSAEGQTPLHFAALATEGEAAAKIIRMLLASFGNKLADIVDVNGDTALHLAGRLGKKDAWDALTRGKMQSSNSVRTKNKVGEVPVFKESKLDKCCVM
eukprot:g4570.t1